MQITEKLRKDILFALPKLSVVDADEIAAKCEVNRITVYRYYRKLKSLKPVYESPVIIELAALAATKKKSVVVAHKRIRQIEKQLSEIK